MEVKEVKEVKEGRSRDYSLLRFSQRMYTVSCT